MISEKMPMPGADENDLRGQEQMQREIGPLSDYFETGGPRHYPEAASALIEKLDFPRDPNQEINVEKEREHISERLEEVSKEIERGRELAAVRSSLGAKSGEEETKQVEALTEAKEKLEEEEKKLTMAEEFNDILGSFGNLTDDELAAIAETGLTKKGKELYNKKGEVIHTDVARTLARMYSSGMVRVTWRALGTLSQIVNAILHDISSVAKGILGIGRRRGNLK